MALIKRWCEPPRTMRKNSSLWNREPPPDNRAGKPGDDQSRLQRGGGVPSKGNPPFQHGGTLDGLLEGKASRAITQKLDGGQLLLWNGLLMLQLLEDGGQAQRPINGRREKSYQAQVARLALTSVNPFPSKGFPFDE